ncbi:hypothetical protein RCO48_33470 [Peribacillus frigoritolerans]|nr:hypothetical protein [Peribacillus frigoritolerans]
MVQEKSVILVSVLTFGLVTPSDLAWLAEADSLKDTKKGLVEEEGLAYLPFAGFRLNLKRNSTGRSFYRTS